MQKNSSKSNSSKSIVSSSSEAKVSSLQGDYALVTDEETKEDPKLMLKMYKLGIRSALTGSNNSGFVKTVLSVHGQLTTTAGGAVLGGVSLDPSPSSEWSTFATLFDEFRVTSGHVKVIPTLSGMSTAGLVTMAFDNDDATVPSSIDEVVSYQNSKLDSLSKGQIFRFKRPNITSSAYWVDVASPATSLGMVKLVLALCSGSSNVAYYWGRLEVEFRGRR
jgi:hypothetical protein